MNNIVNNTTTANVINTSDIATNRNIVLCGVGGRGTVLASKLLADSYEQRHSCHEC
ncbi:MAG: hypothetical protein ACLSGB_11060 [Dorea sp.]